MAKTVNTPSVPSAEEIAMLQAVVAAAITEALTPLAAENAELRARLDKASACMSTIIAEIKAMKAAEPTTAVVARKEPSTKRIPRDEFDRALEDLRAEDAENGGVRKIFPVAVIHQRAITLRAMEDNRDAASE